MIIGKHVSIAGGIAQAPGRAKAIGCNALQVFARNPRSWQGRKLSVGEGEQVKAAMEKLGMEVLVVHAIYLINLASPDDQLWEKSRQAIAEDYRRAGEIGADYLVVHPGSHHGSGLKEGVLRIGHALNGVLESSKNETKILLENVAGAGTALGSNFTQIHDIIKEIAEKDRIGFCLDTCHAFAAGYDLSTNQGLEQTLRELEREIGFDYLKMLHINDSRYALSSRKDQHAHLGKGQIGQDGLARIVNHPDLRHLPFILETASFQGRDQDVELIISLSNH